MRRWGCAVLLAVFAAVGGPSSAEETSADAGKLRLTLVSYNIRVPTDKAPNDWASRKTRVAEDLRRMKPDICGVQEAHPGQIADLRKLSGFASIGTGRNRNSKGEGVPIFYDPRRFEVVEARTVWLSKTPRVYSLAEGSDLPRIITLGIFREKRGGREFVFANTHLHHKNQKVCHPEQIRAVVDELAPYLRRGMTVFLTGDFNSFPESAAYRATAKVLCDSCLKSERKPVRLEFGTYHAFGRLLNKPRPRIDYIWVSPEVRVLRYESVDNIDERGLASSDHYPQLAEVEF